MGTHASWAASVRNFSGVDCPETNWVIAVMKRPNMRFCRAIPAPDAIAATTEMPCRVYSTWPAYVKIR